MAFNVHQTTPTSTSTGGTGSNVDFDAMNRAIVEEAGLQERETLPGIVSVIVDLGIQKQPDAETPFTGTPEEEEAIKLEMPDTYFKDGIDPDTKKEVRLKCWPQKPQPCVALGIDFPDIIVDKGIHFGESKPLPLRIYMGGQFYIPGQGMIVGRPTPLRVVNLDKTRKSKKWSLAQNNLMHKMAVAAKLIKPDEVFLPQNIDQLLGKAFQFDAQVYMKAVGNKEYYTEYVKFTSALGRGQAVGELETKPYLVQFSVTNEEDAVKELRSHIVNTMKQASNYAGSEIQKQIETLRPKKSDTSEEKAESEPEKPADKPKPTPRKAPAPKVEGTDDAVDGDLPW